MQRPLSLAARRVLSAEIDAQIATILEAYRRAAGRRRPVTRPARATDVPIITLRARVTLATGEDRRLCELVDHPHEAGATYALFPWPVDALVFGRSAPAATPFTAPVPTCYPDPEYHGLVAYGGVHLVRVEELVLPPLTDALILLATGVPTIAAYRQRLRQYFLNRSGAPAGERPDDSDLLRQRRGHR